MDLRSEVLRELGGLFDFDAHVWLLTDPVTSVGCSPLADVPVGEELPKLIRLKYLTDVNRWTRLATVPTRARSLVEATSGNPQLSLVWREMLNELGVVDVASTVFADRHGSWGFLDLWRRKPAGRFEPDVIGFLADVSASIAGGLRRCQAATFAAPAVAAQRAMGPVVLLLDDQLRILSQTAASDDWLRVLVPPAHGRPPIPASAYNVAAQLIASERLVDMNPALVRVHLTEGFWVTIRAARLSRSDGQGGGGIAVTIEEASPVDRLEVFSLAFSLSARERELVTLLASGGGTAEVSERLFVSENTVQDHLKSIFQKTSTHSRRTLLSRALGARSPTP